MANHIAELVAFVVVIFVLYRCVRPLIKKMIARSAGRRSSSRSTPGEEADGG